MKRREVHTDNTSNSTDDYSRISVLTYNISTEQRYGEDRIHSLVKLLKASNPDVACIHSVHKSLYDKLESKVSSYFTSFQVFLEEGDDSGMVLLCNTDNIALPEDSEPYYYDYPTTSGRIIGAEIIHKESGKKFQIMATSLNNKDENTREEQCEIIKNVTKDHKNVILVGDFYIENLVEKSETTLSSMFKDCWISMKCPTQVKYTYDGKYNKWIKSGERKRYSRIYYKSKVLLPETLSLIGTKKIKDDISYPISCHYALESIFKIL